MKQILVWLENQWDWFKSFFSEPPDATGKVKGSIKRFLSFWVVVVFLHAYIKRTLIMPIESMTIPEIPDNWMFLIAGIIGLGILDKWVSSKKSD